MRLNKPNSPPPARPAPSATAPARAKRRPWVWVAAVVALALVAWGVWKYALPDPLRDARAALDRRDFRTANELLAKRLAERPSDADTQLLAARAARRGEDPGRAFTLLRSYEQKHGTNPAHEREVRMLRAQGGDAVEADKVLSEYDANPTDADAPFLLEAYLEGKLRALAPSGSRPAPQTESSVLAAVAANEANLFRAIEKWQAARLGTADQVQARLWRARVLLAANKHADAVAALREGVQLDPSSVEARFQLALSVSLTDPGEAVRHLEALHQTHPDNPFVKLGLANAYRMLGRGPDARRIYEGLLTGPHATDARYELGVLDMEEGKLEAAEKHLRAALDAAPNSPDTNVAMSRLHQLAGRPDEAAKYRKRFEELDAERNKPRQ